MKEIKPYGEKLFLVKKYNGQMRTSPAIMKADVGKAPADRI